MPFSQRLGELYPPDVIVQLVKTVSITVVYYAIEICPTNKSDVLSLHLQYVTDYCFRKILNMKSKNIVQKCEIEFGMLPVL